MVADLYLGYGLAASIAGVHEPAAARAVPAAARGVPRAPCRRARARGRHVPGRRRSCRPGRAAEHAAAVEQVRAAIGRGDVYQVNLVQHLRAPFDGLAAGARDGARSRFDAAWAHALHGDGWSIVSATPELFLQTRGDVARTMPIKGTRPAGVGRADRRRAPRTGPST